MKEEMFNELVESMRQAVAIRRGELQPARVTPCLIRGEKVLWRSPSQRAHDVSTTGKKPRKE